MLTKLKYYLGLITVALSLSGGIGIAYADLPPCPSSLPVSNPVPSGGTWKHTEGALPSASADNTTTGPISLLTTQIPIAGTGTVVCTYSYVNNHNVTKQLMLGSTTTGKYQIGSQGLWGGCAQFPPSMYQCCTGAACTFQPATN